MLKDSDQFSTFLRDREEMKRLIKLLEFLSQYNDRMELQQILIAAYCFFLGDDERTPKNLRELLELPSSTTSRNMAAIGEYGIRGTPGYRWIETHEDPQQRNRKLIKVTPKGHKVRRMMAAILRGEV